jgi:signal-transduction protein with cAMP-binding, CBS, and nucleotidyltransferase domain
MLHDRKLYFVQANQAVHEVAKEMAARNVGAIMVLDGTRLCGIFSERDLMIRVVVAGSDPKVTPVADVMTRDLAKIEDSAPCEAAMEMMQSNKCRHLPVMRGDEVVGLISMRDLMAEELEEKRAELQHMRNYIAGGV